MDFQKLAKAVARSRLSQEQALRELFYALIEEFGEVPLRIALKSAELASYMDEMDRREFEFNEYVEAVTGEHK